MRELGNAVFLLPLVGFAISSALSCGARTNLADELAPRPDGGLSDAAQGGGGEGGQVSVGGAGGAGGDGGQGAAGGGPGGQGGGTTHPIISSSVDSFIQAETSVARAPNGPVAVAWIDVDNSGSSRIGYTISSDDGGSFPPPSIAVTPGGRLASDPVIAVDAAGSFYMTWVGYFTDMQGDLSDMHVYVARAKTGSTVFEAPVEVSDPGAGNLIHDKPWIAITNQGTVLVTYAVASQVQSQLVVARSPDGVNWQESVILKGASAFWNLAYPCVPRTGNRVWVTYLEFTNNIKVGLTWSDDGGQSWNPLGKNTTVNIKNEPVAYDDPTCVAEGNEVWVSYGLSKDPPNQTDSAKSYALRVAHSGDAGASIDYRIDAHDAQAAFFLHPQIAIEESGALDLVYYAGVEDEDENGTYRWSRAPKPAGGFLPSVVVESPVTFLQARADVRWLGDYTGVFWAEDKLYTSYVVNTSGFAEIAFARVKTQ